MKNLIFITGAARSGKSVLAEELAHESSRPVYYLATMQILEEDQEQLRRLELHRKRRPSDWQTIDAAFSAEKVIEEIPDGSFAIFDCLSLYVTNMLIENSEDPYAQEELILQSVDLLLKAIAQKSRSEFIVVSNEVGWGVVPESKLGRAFRDVLGLANQKLAAKARKAYLCCSGLRVELK